MIHIVTHLSLLLGIDQRWLVFSPRWWGGGPVSGPSSGMGFGWGLWGVAAGGDDVGFSNPKDEGAALRQLPRLLFSGDGVEPYVRVARPGRLQSGDDVVLEHLGLQVGLRVLHAVEPMKDLHVLGADGRARPADRGEIMGGSP